MAFYHLVVLFCLSILSVVLYFSKRKRYSASLFVVSLYAASIFGSFFLTDEFSVSPSDYSIEATLVFLAIFGLFSLPLVVSKADAAIEVSCANKKAFNVICWLFVGLGILTYTYFLPVVMRLFLSGESILTLRTEMVGGEVYYHTGPLYYLVTFFCQFFPIVIVFYFHSLVFNPNRVWFNRLLLFSSTGYVVNVLSSVGRDGFVLWTLSFVFGFLVYKNMMEKKIIKRVKRGLIIFLCVFSVFFLAISMSRFYTDGVGSVFIQKMIWYGAQQYGEFQRFYNADVVVESDFSKVLPLAQPLLGNKMVEKSILEDHFEFLEAYGFSKYVFKFFIGTLLSWLGIRNLLIFAILISTMFTFIAMFQRRAVVGLGMVVIFTLYCQMLLHGVFYYKLGYAVSNLYVICVAFLAFVLSFKFKVGKRWRNK